MRRHVTLVPDSSHDLTSNVIPPTMTDFAEAGGGSCGCCCSLPVGGPTADPHSLNILLTASSLTTLADAPGRLAAVWISMIRASRSSVPPTSETLPSTSPCTPNIWPNLLALVG